MFARVRGCPVEVSLAQVVRAEYGLRDEAGAAVIRVHFAGGGHLDVDADPKVEAVLRCLLDP